MKKIMVPTNDYVRSCLAVIEHLKGLAHITGGGLIDNVPRIIPDGLTAQIKITWKLTEFYKWIKMGGITHGKVIPDEEMLRTFNSGIGMVVILETKNIKKVKARLENFGHTVYKIGRVVEGDEKIKIIGELK